MKNSMKKVLSLVVAGAIALTSVFAGNAADAVAVKKVANVSTAKLEIQAAADKEVSASTVVTFSAVGTSGALTAATRLTCNYNPKLAASIATASAVVTSGDAFTVTVTATKSAVAVTDAAVNVLADNQTIANVLVTIKGVPSVPAVKKGTKTIAFKKERVIIARGKSKKVGYTIKKTAAADKAKAVKVSSDNEDIVTAAKVSGKKQIEISVSDDAAQGDSANVTIKSGNKTSTIKVLVKNPTKKVAPKKSSVKIKKGAKKKAVVIITAKNAAKKTTDTMTVTSSNQKIAVVKKTVIKKGKGVITVKAKKKRGTSKLTVKVGKKKTAFFVYVR